MELLVIARPHYYFRGKKVITDIFSALRESLGASPIAISLFESSLG